METALIFALAWAVNTGLNLAFFNDPPPPPQHKICYEEVVVDGTKRLVPYECVGGKAE